MGTLFSMGMEKQDGTGRGVCVPDMSPNSQEKWIQGTGRVVGWIPSSR